MDRKLARKNVMTALVLTAAGYAILRTGALPRWAAENVGSVINPRAS